MQGNILDDSHQIVPVPKVLEEISGREDRAVEAGMAPLRQFTAPIRVQWEYTNICDLQCAYCYNSTDRANKLALPQDATLTLAHQLAQTGVFEVILSGGEVFTDWDLLKQIGQILTSYHVGIHLITNGWAMSSEYLTELQKWHILSVQISIDGIDERIHDSMRGRRGSWDHAVRALDMFHKAGMFTVVGCVLTRKNWQTVADFIDFCFYLGADRVICGDIIAMGSGLKTSGQLAMSNEEYEKANLLMQKKAEQYKDLMSVAFAKDPGFTIARHLILRPTGYVIRYDGSVIPTCLLPVPFGNLQHESLEAIWSKVGGDIAGHDGVIQALKAIRVETTPALKLVRSFFSADQEGWFL